REYKMPRARTFAQELKSKFTKALSDSRAAVRTDTPIVAEAKPVSAASPSLFSDEDATDAGSGASDGEPLEAPVDVRETYSKAAIAKVASDTAFTERIRKSGMPWMGIIVELEKVLPDVIADRKDLANKLVPRFLTETFGERDKGWETKKQPK